FLAVHMQALDVGALLHLGIGGAQHGRHMKYVRDAVALEHVGEALRAGHFLAVVSDLHFQSCPWVLLGLVSRARRSAKRCDAEPGPTLCGPWAPDQRSITPRFALRAAARPGHDACVT